MLKLKKITSNEIDDEMENSEEREQNLDPFKEWQRKLRIR